MIFLPPPLWNPAPMICSMSKDEKRSNKLKDYRLQYMKNIISQIKEEIERA